MSAFKNYLVIPLLMQRWRFGRQSHWVSLYLLASYHLSYIFSEMKSFREYIQKFLELLKEIYPRLLPWKGNCGRLYSKYVVLEFLVTEVLTEWNGLLKHLAFTYLQHQLNY